MKPAGINGADVKRLNRLTVLQYLAQHKGVSRVQLTQQTNLTKMTISNIINEFLEQGLVSAQQSESGQKLPQAGAAAIFSNLSGGYRHLVIAGLLQRGCYRYAFIHFGDAQYSANGRNKQHTGTKIRAAAVCFAARGEAPRCGNRGCVNWAFALGTRRAFKSPQFFRHYRFFNKTGD